MTAAAVILAAGAGRRFSDSGGEGPKQLATIEGIPMIDRVLAAATDAGLDEVVLVTGAVPLDDHAAGATVVPNERWTDGLASSLCAGIGYARTAGHDSVTVGLADQPGVTTASWTAVTRTPAHTPVVVATYDGRRGHPVRLDAAVWDLLPASGDRGARDLMSEHPDLVTEIPCTGDPSDIDTKEDSEAWS